MKLVPVNVNEIEEKLFYNKCKNQQIISEFVATGALCAKVDGWHHKNTYSCAHALAISARRMHIYTVTAISRKGNVYLIKRDILDG